MFFLCHTGKEKQNSIANKTPIRLCCNTTE